MEQQQQAKLGYTIDEFVDAAGIGRTKVYEYLKTRRLKSRKAGRRTVILVADAAEFMASLPEREVA